MKQPRLQFDFNQHTTIFTKPVDIIQTNNLSKVHECLQDVQTAIDNGYYVAGYLSYEVTYSFFNNLHTNKENKHPLLWFGVFNKPETAITTTSNHTAYTIGTWKIRQSKAQYKKQFSKIMESIQQERIEQINYTVPFDTDFTGNSAHYYERLKNAQKSSYNAYLQLGDIDILSASPELFFEVKNEVITVKPMKGTIHRGKTLVADEANKQWLTNSRKNQLENDLIVALMKEEILPLTQDNHVTVSSLYDVEKYPTVYQMTSTIKGNLKHNLPLTTILQTLFPCGSISGVPKQETLTLIDEVEPYPREVYCGAIGYFAPDGDAIFNVPIRTVTIDRNSNQATYGAGGAITAQSQVEEEYEEMLTKTKVLDMKETSFELLETIGLTNGKFILFDAHMKRLLDSARYFDFIINEQAIVDKLHTLKKQYATGNWRVRLSVNSVGAITVTCAELKSVLEPNVTLAQHPIDRENTFHYHKTTYRKIYEEHANKQSFDTILWNDNNEVTEFTIGNIVIEQNGIYYTPPIECGVLPGTYREKLVHTGKVQEKVIYTSELTDHTNMWLINSVRGWIKVNFNEEISN